MKRIKNADINFRINPKLVYLNDFVIRFYTVNSRYYFFEKTPVDVVEEERDATIDDVDVILSGGTKVTEYYIPIEWDELLTVGEGVLNYRVYNNIEDPIFPDNYFNKEIAVTTDFYIDCDIHVDPDPEESLIERIIALEEHLESEIVDRETADTFISGAVDTEIARAISAETELSEALQAESDRAISAETILQDAIDAETNRATSAETVLSEAITNEVNRATSAETTLNTAITDETNRATSAETALDEKIDAETNRATSAETELSEALTSETNRATSAETTLDEKIDAETNRATSAETTLDEKISAETLRAEGVESALSASIDTVSGNVISETSRATSAETTLDEKIDAETSRATSAETTLNTAITNEVSRATSAETSLNEKINTVSGNVISETSRATTAEGALSGAIDSLDVRFFDDAKYENSGNTKVINFYNGNVVKATIDASEFIVDGMIDDVVVVPSGSTSVLVITWNTDAGSKVVTIDIGDIFEADNYYTKSETSGKTEIANALALKLDISDFNTYSGATDTLINSKASQSTVDALSGTVTAHTSNTTIHLTSGNVQTQIDNSISGKANSSDVYLKTETSGKTEIANALATKLDVSDFNTYSGAVDTLINSKASESDLTAHTANTTVHITAAERTAWNNKSDFSGSYNDLTDKLSAGTNVTITNNVISASGDITSGDVQSMIASAIAPIVEMIEEDEEITAQAFMVMDEKKQDIIQYLDCGDYA